MAAKQGPNFLFCMPNRSMCIVSVSVSDLQRSASFVGVKSKNLLAMT
jgi:hypothetical protein